MHKNENKTDKPNLRRLDPADFPSLYRTHIMRDFAAAERRPLHAINRLMRKNRYTCWVWEDTESMIAYACFLQAEGVDSVLLDYFAVIPKRRGGGIGSQFLQVLRGAVDTGGIIIESEMPRHAADAADKEIRKRRIAFYTRNGAKLSGYGWYAFSVDYNLLCLPVQKPMDEAQLGADIVALYESCTPAFILRSQTRLYTI